MYGHVPLVTKLPLLVDDACTYDRPLKDAAYLSYFSHSHVVD